MSRNADDDLLSLSIREFLDRAGDRTPTPGGGSVAALVGALAAAMGQMVARYTIGNAKYAGHEPAVRAWLEELARARDAFCQLMAEDIAAYQRLSAAMKSREPDAAEEKARALAAATTVPMEMVAVAAAVVAGMDSIKDRCNRYLLSDLVVGAVLCNAAARAAAANVRVNLARSVDRAEADRLAADLANMLDHTSRRCDSVAAYALTV